MAASQHTTRRALLAGTTGLAAAGTLPSLAASPMGALRERQRIFLKGWQSFGPRADLAARHAVAAGMDPDDLMSAFFSLKGVNNPDLLPALIFQMPDLSFRTFRPRGEQPRHG